MERRVIATAGLGMATIVLAAMAPAYRADEIQTCYTEYVSQGCQALGFGMFDMCVNGCGYEPTIIKCTENIPHYPWGFVECGEEIP